MSNIYILIKIERYLFAFNELNAKGLSYYIGNSVLLYHLVFLNLLCNCGIPALFVSASPHGTKKIEFQSNGGTSNTILWHSGWGPLTFHSGSQTRGRDPL